MKTFDVGCILAQRAVPVLTNDTAEQLAARVLHEVTYHDIISMNIYQHHDFPQR